MFDFLSKAGSSVMDTLSSAGSAVSEGVQSGLSHTFEKLQDPEFMQQAGLLSAVMSNDQGRYQGALNSYEKRRTEIARQKREDIQRAEGREWALSDAKDAHQRSFETIDKNQENTLKNKEVDFGYQTTRDATQQGYTLQNKTVDHNNGLARDKHQQSIVQENEVFKNSDMTSQQVYLAGPKDGAQPQPVHTSVNPEQGTTKQVYQIPAGMSQTGKDTTVTVEGEAPTMVDGQGAEEQAVPQQQNQVPGQQQQVPTQPQPTQEKGNIHTLKPKQTNAGREVVWKKTVDGNGNPVEVAFYKDGTKAPLDPITSYNSQDLKLSENKEWFGIENKEVRTEGNNVRKANNDRNQKVSLMNTALHSIDNVVSQLSDDTLSAAQKRGYLQVAAENYARAMIGGSGQIHMKSVNELLENPTFLKYYESIVQWGSGGPSEMELTRVRDQISGAQDAEHSAIVNQWETYYEGMLRYPDVTEEQARKLTLHMSRGSVPDMAKYLPGGEKHKPKEGSETSKPVKFDKVVNYGSKPMGLKPGHDPKLRSSWVEVH